MRTQVVIVGAGPAGLVLGRLLRARGVASVVLEARDREYVQERVRAGLLEPGTVEALAECGVDERLRREGMPQERFDLRFGGRAHLIPVLELTGRRMTVYPQSEIVKDLISARLADGDGLLFDCPVVGVEGIEGDRPVVSYRREGRLERLECEFVAGCDGFHGIARRALESRRAHVYEHRYPFAHLGILARVEPASDHLVYAHHEDGVGLLTLRAPGLTRLYIQCAADEDLARWPDERVWAELHRRLATEDGFVQPEGPVLEKSISQLRSFVVDPMQHGRLFLAGDAAHVVPPNGAKGLNAAVADVRVLARALGAFYRDGDESRLRSYSRTCLERIWRVEQFSTLMVTLLHRFPAHDDFQRRLQLAQLEHIVTSRTTATSLAESYVGANQI
jgi:p-hydroxybenzoate 3-monooxygenase